MKGTNSEGSIRTMDLNQLMKFATPERLDYETLHELTLEVNEKIPSDTPGPIPTRPIRERRKELLKTKLIDYLENLNKGGKQGGKKKKPKKKSKKRSSFKKKSKIKKSKSRKRSKKK